MSLRFVSMVLRATLIYACGATAVMGQSPTGVLKGQVVDESGAAVAEQTISIYSLRSGQNRVVTTGPSGRFRVQLAPGDYVLEATGSGYSTVQIQAVNMAVGGVADLTIPVERSDVEEIQVFGEATPLMKTAVGETGLQLSLDEVAQLPVARNIEAVAMLAPGTVPGIDAFGFDPQHLVSFGGASVAENAYFIDGLNVSDFLIGFGGSSVPFEFYDQFQIKTGGYSAEFGRSTGGVINAATKRGGNDFEFGVVSYYSPEWGRGTSPDIYRHDGTIYDVNSEDRASNWTVDLYAGGPIIRDRLFFFVLYEPRDFEDAYMEGGDTDTLIERRIANDFWGGNLTWHINDYHTLSATAFSDERNIAMNHYAFDATDRTTGDLIGDATRYRGGDNTIVSYDGQFGDRLSLSALYGVNRQGATRLSSNDLDCPAVLDFSDSSTSVAPGCWVNGYVLEQDLRRDVYRLDLTYAWGNHTLRAGVDYEDREYDRLASITGSALVEDLPGGVRYVYESWNVGDQIWNGAIVPDANGDGSRVDTVSYSYLSHSGLLDTVSQAWYLEDVWDVTDTLTVSFGLRNEVFENYNADGDKYFDIEGQWAPRLALSWSPRGSVDQKFSLNWGRYHLPMMSVPLATSGVGILDFNRYFVYDGERNQRTAGPANIDANGVPTSEELGSALVWGDGSVPDARAVLDHDIEPMYHDEWIVGYERRIGDDWTAGIRYINRDLKSLIEDVSTLTGLEAIGFPGAIDWSQDCSFVMTNPGTDITTYCNVNGELQEVFIPADAMPIPTAKRSYDAVELTVQKALSNRWALNGSYTWSKSEGNVEGTVKSDLGQIASHMTEDFDVPAQIDGAYGYLPNDRRHKLRLWGLYEVTDRLTVSANVFAQSGKPVNAFGRAHPDYVSWGYTTFYVQQPDGSIEFNPRGSRGRTDWTTQVDLAAVYAFQWGDRTSVELRAEVFNLFDADRGTEVNEQLEEEPDLYLLPMHYQQPRYLRFGFALRYE